ncbi:MAG: amidase [Candidatus Heimdallarchaeota archaeon]|nr:amidase [Candidatus Heimdallarchaeota archaeon]
MDKRDQAISDIHLQATQDVIGLSFTYEERQLLHPGVQENLEKYQKSRDVIIPNNVSPALYFSPVLPGHTYSSKIKGNNYSGYLNLEIPSSDEKIAFLTVLEQASLIKSGKLTSKSLTKIYIDRIKQFDPKLRSVITLLDDYAIKQAIVADQEIESGNYKGYLHGIPYGAKDLLAFPNYPTTWGAIPFRNQMLDETSAVITRLYQAGAILLAKLSLGALAWGDVWFDGVTKSPWNFSEGSRGSSAGPGSATGAGLISFAIGSETRGSIVAPSTRCGVSGLRPTFGRVSRFGAMALSWSMDKLGPMCRSVEDCALVFHSIHGSDPKDLTAVQMPFGWDKDFDIQQIRLGYIHDEMQKERDYKGFDDASLSKFEELGIDVRPVNLPEFDAETISFILNCEAAASFDELTTSKKIDKMVRQGEKSWPNEFRKARFIPAVEYIKANRLRFILMQSMARLFQEVDVYISPTFGRSLLITNLTGHPAVVIPNGYKDNGLPNSITFTGDLYKDAETLFAARFLQINTKFHKLRPNLP